jgi:hypothetical protein
MGKLRPPQTSSIPWLPERLILRAFSRPDFLIATEPEIYMFGKTDQRIADLGTTVFAFMFGKQADSGLPHRGYSLVVADATIFTQSGQRVAGF